MVKKRADPLNNGSWPHAPRPSPGQQPYLFHRSWSASTHTAQEPDLLGESRETDDDIILDSQFMSPQLHMAE